TQIDDRLCLVHCRAVAAVIASCLGDDQAVLREAATLPEELEGYGCFDPAQTAWVAAAEEIEARISSGDVDGAGRRLAALETRSRRLERPRSLAAALRGRGL